MGKVELSLKEYNDLTLATTNALNEKLALKMELIVAGKRIEELEERSIDLLARCFEVSAWVWSHKLMEEGLEITNENLEEFVSKYIFEDYTREEVLKGVKRLYERTNKR